MLVITAHKALPKDYPAFKLKFWRKMKDNYFSLLLIISLLVGSTFAVYDEPRYDYSAYTQCKSRPEAPLYNGGILKDEAPRSHTKLRVHGNDTTTPAFILYNLTGNTIYSFSSWIKVEGVNSSASLKLSFTTDNTTLNSVGTVIAKPKCWSFLKGGFVLNSPSSRAFLYFQDPEGGYINIRVASSSLQPFSQKEWRLNQQYIINTKRKRATIIHISDVNGVRLQGAKVVLEQVSREFPFGSAIASNIIGNQQYQKWFTDRFNVAEFENELKWYSTEKKPGVVNYTVPDQMLKFARANQIMVRGHNIFWADANNNPSWIRNLTGPQLKRAVNFRIQSLVQQYKNEFVHWDISNEMLHFDFYEQRLGPNASLEFFETVHKLDPLATLFMNEYDVVETCDYMNSSVDAYISRLRELQRDGVSMAGIGLEGHFNTVPNPPLIRAILDKLATLGLPIWLTEVDINNTLGQENQARYLEAVLREGFSHPSVNGIVLWSALHAKGCFRMCLTDNNFNNLPAGDVVDNLLREWQTGIVKGHTDNHGSFTFFGFLGEYKVSVYYSNTAVNSTFSLYAGDETRHVYIQI